MDQNTIIKVRNARTEDAESLVVAQQKRAQEKGFLILDPDEIKVKDCIEKIRLLTDPQKGIYLVAEINNEIVGHGLLERHNERALSHILRLNLLTHVGRDKRGVGSTILKCLVDWARATNALKIETSLRIWNRESFRLYRKFGFEQEGILFNHVRVEEDRAIEEVLMGLQLDKPELKDIEGDHGAVVFFPWLRIDAPIEMENVLLTPFPEETGVGYPKQVVDILNLVRDGGNRSQESAVVVRLKTKANFEPLTVEDRKILFDLAEIIAFNALSERALFGHTDYYNKDTYKIHAQGFAKNSEFVVIDSRRRDGGSSNIIPYEYYSLHRPFHVSVCRGIFEGDVLDALILTSKSEKWDLKYSEAIQLYNSANTDDPSLNDRTEVVRIVSAFERLYQMSYSKDTLFNRQLTSALDIVPKISPKHQFRLAEDANYKKSNSVKSVWSFDIYHTRNHHAHGNGTPGENKIWSLPEHLILASYLFPLAVKIELEKDGFYHLTDDDKEALFTFDHIASQESLFLSKPQHEHDPEEDDEFPMLKAKRAARWDWKLVNLPDQKK